jgi:phospholipid/cholesterol/gamma-HCH transport system substrate-binding protein
MRENVSEVIVGAVVILAAAGFLLYAAQATGLARISGSYDVTASFRSAEGVRVGTDVRMSGVKIGTVTQLRLNTDTFRADAVIAVDRGVPIPEDSTAVVATEGLLGGTYVEIVPGGSLDNLAPGAEIIDTQGAVSVLNLLLTYIGGGGGSSGPAPAP